MIMRIIKVTFMGYLAHTKGHLHVHYTITITPPCKEQ